MTHIQTQLLFNKNLKSYYTTLTLNIFDKCHSTPIPQNLVNSHSTNRLFSVNADIKICKLLRHQAECQSIQINLKLIILIGKATKLKRQSLSSKIKPRTSDQLRPLDLKLK